MIKISSRFLNIFLLNISLLLISQPLAANPACETHITACEKTLEKLEKINYWTDYFFELARPEMKGKKIKQDQTLYHRERIAIQDVIKQVVFCSCQQPQLKHYYFLSQRENHKPRALHRRRTNYSDRINRRLTGQQESEERDFNWIRNKNYYFDGLYSDLTDALFYARHPEFSRQVSPKSSLNLSTEWIFIRQSFLNLDQEIFIKQHLIPVCDRNFEEE